MADTSRSRYDTTEPESKFTSRFRKDKTERKERTERRARATVDNQNNEVEESSTAPVRTSVNVRAAASVFNSKAEGENERVVSRMNRLNVRGDTSSSKTTKKEEKNDAEETTTAEKSSKDASSNSSRKRKDRKNLREKRRSTGVVILPNMESGDKQSEETKSLKENTAQNELAAEMEVAQRGNSRNAAAELDGIVKEELLLQLGEYEQAILEWKDALEKANKEIDSLRQDNQRLKDENSSLLKVVNQLSVGGGKGK